MPVAICIFLAACGQVSDPPGGHPDAGGGRDAAADAATDASQDASFDAAPDAGCPRTTVEAEDVADTTLASGAPDLAFGGLDVTNVSSGNGTVGLYRFAFAAGALPADADLRAVRVTFTYAATATDCAPACGSCDAIDAAGDFTLFFARNDWDEATATWNRRSPGQAWGAPGAGSSGVDRGDPAVRQAHAAHASETFSVGDDRVGDLQAWRTGDEVSFLLVPSNGGAFVIATREYASQDCAAAGFAPPALEVEYCTR